MAAASVSKLFLLDAMALIYRAHFAFSKSPRINSAGQNTSAVFGFANTLLEVLSKEKPTHIGVAFDTNAPTFRHEQFGAYKAGRQAQPEDIALAIPLVKQMLVAMDIPVIELDGYEADDIIGTLAIKAQQAGFKVYMMTPDKDYCQLVSENIFVYKPSFMGNGVEILGVEQVLAKWEIEQISQVIDILGLQGDAVDNIPGVPGIGEKTAKKLIKEYKSIENLLAHTHEQKGKLQANLIEFKDQALLSKHLATICLDVPVELDEIGLCCGPFNQEKLGPFLDKLEFRSMAKRLFEPPTAKKTTDSPQLGLFSDTSQNQNAQDTDDTNDNQPQQALRNIGQVETNYQIAHTKELMHSLAGFLGQQKYFCFDTETTGLNPLEAEIVGLSFSWQAGKAYYVPLPAELDRAIEIMQIFKKCFEDDAIMKIGQNIKFDMAMLMIYDIRLQGIMYDTMLAHYLLEPDQRHNMDDLAKNYLQYQPISITDLIGKKGKEQLNMSQIPLDQIAEYACEDADITLQLFLIFQEKIREKNLEELLLYTEGPLIAILAEMEAAGVAVDTAALALLSDELGKEIVLLEEQIYTIASEKFNLGSPLQLGKILFDKLALDAKAKKTKTGQYATGEQILSQLAFEHPIAALILEWREMQKLKSTYIDALPTLLAPDGRLHTSYNQAVAATGRLSSTNPNLQNIPIRTARGKQIRKAFVARDSGHVIFSVDYSQIELRIMAHFCGDPTMKQAFVDNQDIHTATAAKIFKVELEQVTSDMRRKAKTANFGIIYGISAFGLAQRLAIPRSEASQIIKAYFEQFPAIKAYMDDTIGTARDLGYVSTLLGRRRQIADIDSRNPTLRGYAERNAINAPIQGTAADMIKVAMIAVDKWLKQNNMQTKMILQVHDELVFDAPIHEIEALKIHIPKLMQNALILDVPIQTGVGYGANWLDAH